MSQTKIGSGFIKAGAISANTILSTNVITADLIKAGAVGNSEIATSAVGPAELATGAVSANTKIGSGAITAINLATGSVSNVHIQTNAVGAAEIAAGAVGATEVSIGKLATANAVFTHNSHTYARAQSGRVESITVGAANVQLNFANANIFNLTLGINTHLNLPSNPTVGQGGSIIVTQDGTGSRTLSYAGAWEFPSGTAPTLTTTANAQDRIDYLVVAANAIHAVASLNVT